MNELALGAELITSGLFAVCRMHTAKPVLHTAKHCVALGKNSSRQIEVYRVFFSRAYGKLFAVCYI